MWAWQMRIATTAARDIARHFLKVTARFAPHRSHGGMVSFDARNRRISFSRDVASKVRWHRFLSSLSSQTVLDRHPAAPGTTSEVFVTSRHNHGARSLYVCKGYQGPTTERCAPTWLRRKNRPRVFRWSGHQPSSKWLQVEKNMDVIATGNVGRREGLSLASSRRPDMGAIARGRRHARGGTPRHVSASSGQTANTRASTRCSPRFRPIISKHLVDIAHEHASKVIAHGCTGKGNDQVRFETSIRALDPSSRYIACLCASGTSPRVTLRWRGQGPWRARAQYSAGVQLPGLHRRQPVGAAPSSAACSRTPGTSRLATSGR